MRDSVKIEGRILYLTKDPELLRRQLDGEEIAWDPSIELIDNISTDELTPGWVCYYYDDTLARYCLVGLRGGNVEKDSIKNGGFGVIVSGPLQGLRQQPRDRAVLARLRAGVQVVIAKSIEKIYGQNCQNIGLLTSTDFGTDRARSSAARRSRSRVHQGARPDRDRDRRVRRSVRLQQGAARGRDHAAQGRDRGSGR
jgi:hypothetical protein